MDIEKPSRFEVEGYIARLLRYLGIEQAHFAARLDTDWTGLLANRPEIVMSLTLVCPGNIDPVVLGHLGPRLLVINDDQQSGQRVARAMATLPKAESVILPNYFGLPWSDVAADRPNELTSSMIAFLERTSSAQTNSRRMAPAKGEGEFEGVAFCIRGSGPPLVLLPLWLAPSQWDPVVSALSERYCTITLSGDKVGFFAVLEERGRSGYIRVVNNILEEIPLHSGERLLEVGCGSGVLSRWLAHRTAKANPVVAMDINPFLVREAETLAGREGVGDVVKFRTGDAEALPCQDNDFDATMAFTVLEEGDADRMLSEMIRVTRPGGSVAVAVRGLDMPWHVNLNLPAELKAKVEAPTGLASVAKGGCADVSLYRRVHEAGLTDIKVFPQLAAFSGPMGYYYLDRIQAGLSGHEAEEWNTAMAEAEIDGTLFIAQPFHCAVGTRPR